MKKTLLLLVVTSLAAGAAQAQEYPRTIPSPGGFVAIPTVGGQRAYDGFNYAPARRAGDWVYLSGVVVGPYGEPGRDTAAFKSQLRRGFGQMQAALAAAQATFADVVMVNSFHVWKGPGYAGTRDEQIAAVAQVKAEFIKAPHPAWTAVGTSGLLSDDGVVEIQLIAYAPLKP